MQRQTFHCGFRAGGRERAHTHLFVVCVFWPLPVHNAYHNIMRIVLRLSLTHCPTPTPLNFFFLRAGPAARFPNQMDLMKLVRERYLLFAQCVESKPGQEPKHPYLYPQPAVAAAHH